MGVREGGAVGRGKGGGKGVVMASGGFSEICRKFVGGGFGIWLIPNDLTE